MDVSNTSAGSVKVDGASFIAYPATTPYDVATYATVQAYPAEGWVFDSWTGDISSTDNPVTVNVDCVVSITATFKADPNAGTDDPVLGYTVYIPHITGGASDWNEYIQVDNLSSAAASFTLTLYGSSGETLYSANSSVAALDKTILYPKSINSGAMSGMITYSEPKLNFRTTQENNIGGGVAEFRLTDDLGDALGFYFSDVVSSIGWKGMALTNFSDTTAYVSLTVYGDGGIAGIVNVSIGPKQKIVGLYGDWFPLVDFTQVQVIKAESTVPTAAPGFSGVAISGDLTNSLLLFTTGAVIQ